MAISTPVTGELRLALDEILVRENVRELDEAHVDNLAQSIALRGLLVPLIVQPVDAGKQGQSEDRSLGHRRSAATRAVRGHHRRHYAPDSLGLESMSASSSQPTITEVLRFEDLPLGSRGSRRAVVRWSDGSEGEALTWYADEILICEGDLIGKTSEQLRSLHFRRDRDWLQS